ncbi:MAG: hypothetical protein WCK29_02855 [archaeon]
MSGQKKSRVEKLIEKILVNEKTQGYFDSIKNSFDPFIDKIKTPETFYEWAFELDKKISNGNMNKSERNFYLEISKLDSFSKDFFGGFFSRKFAVALSSYAIFKKIPSQCLFFGISHKIKGPKEHEDWYGTAEITIEPGASLEETIKYIKKNWAEISKIDEYFSGNNLVMSRSSVLVKRVREKTEIERDKAIREFSKKKLTDIQISVELGAMGFKTPSLSIIRKVRSNLKKMSKR